jgi:ribosome-binding ATPase YchF (GTP1/OBG family)
MVAPDRPCSSPQQLIHNPPRLPRIKAWIDANNPGDPLIPFSVALEERLAPLPAEEKAEEEKTVGATSAMGKITHAGYTCLDVSSPSHPSERTHTVA